MKRVYFLCLFCLIASFSCALEKITAKVVTVIDGNTIEVVNGNRKYRIILEGIDCPELGQEYGREAKLFLEEWILQKQVTVKINGKDQDGNYLGIVTIDDDDPRIALLREGLAWTSEKNPHPDLEPYRVWAEKKEKGLWKQRNPTPPWVYRRQQSIKRAKSS